MVRGKTARLKNGKNLGRVATKISNYLRKRKKKKKN